LTTIFGRTKQGKMGKTFFKEHFILKQTEQWLDVIYIIVNKTAARFVCKSIHCCVVMGIGVQFMLKFQ
jgi:hypothetical protein